MRTETLRSRLLLIAFLFAVSFAYPARISTADDARLVSTTTREGRLAVFDDLWETIAERYYDPAFHGVDWRSRRERFRPLAAKANNTAQFYDVLRTMIAPLRDAHTRVYSPEEKFDWWKPSFVNVGLSIRDIEDRITVVQVESSSPAARAGIHVGDIIQKIDDIPSKQVLTTRLRDYGPDPDESTRFRALTTLFEGAAGSPVKVEWQNRNGKIKSATLQRKRIDRVLGFQIKHEDRWVVIKLDVFTTGLPSDLERQLTPAVRNARGLILDLRANGGGDAEAMADIASFFLPSGTQLGKFSDRAGASFQLHTSTRLTSALTSAFHTNVPLVVLTSESTSSAAEILAAALQDNRRAELIGTRTCGCVLAIRNRHTLPDGGILDVSELDYWTSGGVRLEGTGVMPDRVVKPQRRDLYSHRDSVLEQAKAILKMLVK
jgi:carboxyl-terminal processing protease